MKPSAQQKVCWHCNQPGHFRSNCPLLKGVNVNMMDIDQDGGSLQMRIALYCSAEILAARDLIEVSMNSTDIS